MFIRHGKATGSIIHAKAEEPEAELGGEPSEPAPEPVVEPEPEPIEDAIEVELEEPVTDDGLPDEHWQRTALDEYAAQRGLDTTLLPNKAAVVQAIKDGV